MALARMRTGTSGRQQTREGILGAALACFSRYGYRRTSMEEIARQAGISRAAVYLYFKGKEEVFRALSEHLQEDQLAEAEAALKDEDPVEEMLLRVLEAKLRIVIEVVYTSPHGAELLDESSRLCGDIAVAARRRFTAILRRLLADATARGELAPEQAGLSPAAAAELIADVFRGLEIGAEGLTPAASRRRLRQAVCVLVGGLGGTPRGPG
ncbi:MAG: TetR/AcrR family transcriptional regulator [Actinomycetota bacterium]|nr:TetR/AcrR family transcriptional regulator [Actinomycetota bacterium]